jgi:outer membrane protein assembly factor BamD
MIKRLLTLGIIIGLCGCAGSKPKEEPDLQERFDRGMEFLEKKKYLRAQEEFNYVVLSGSHTELGDDALFYLGEAYFRNKEYLSAIGEYDRLIRRMAFSPYVEQARWRICEAYVAESPKFYHDQTYTEKALDKLQEFIEDYPDSEYRTEAEKNIKKLREKLAQKLYETGILYLKLDAYDSAIMAFEDLIAKYYDTEFAAKARVGIIRSYCLNLDVEKAQEYYETNQDRIPSAELRQEALNYIQSARKKLEKRKS